VPVKKIRLPPGRALRALNSAIDRHPVGAIPDGWQDRVPLTKAIAVQPGDLLLLNTKDVALLPGSTGRPLEFLGETRSGRSLVRVAVSTANGLHEIPIRDTNGVHTRGSFMGFKVRVLRGLALAVGEITEPPSTRPARPRPVALPAGAKRQRTGRPNPTSVDDSPELDHDRARLALNRFVQEPSGGLDPRVLEWSMRGGVITAEQAGRLAAAAALGYQDRLRGRFPAHAIELLNVQNRLATYLPARPDTDLELEWRELLALMAVRRPPRTLTAKFAYSHFVLIPRPALEQMRPVAARLASYIGESMRRAHVHGDTAYLDRVVPAFRMLSYLEKALVRTQYHCQAEFDVIAGLKVDHKRGVFAVLPSDRLPERPLDEVAASRQTAWQ
jgi:hypothetical protein